LWQSLHVKVNRDTHGQASASGPTVINTSYCPDADDQQGSATPDVAATMIV
jgi:hypothetical protein